MGLKDESPCKVECTGAHPLVGFGTCDPPTVEIIALPVYRTFCRPVWLALIRIPY